MLEGFKDQTKPLTQDEKKMIPHLIQGFKEHIGEKKAISSKDIIKGMRSFKLKHPIKGMDKFSDVRLRKMVNHIRREGLIQELVATSKGYFISTDSTVIAKCVQSIHDRGQAILAVSNAMAERFNNKGLGL